MKKILLIITIILFSTANVSAENTHFIDFSKVLNTSKAGAAAQKSLKKKVQSESEKYKKQEINIRKEEKAIISEKKNLSQEDYQKKVNLLRKKVSELQKNKQTSFNNIAKSRSDSRKALFKAVNPIIKKYMEEKKINLVLDKKSVLMGDTNLEITNQVIEILNSQLPSLKLN